MIQYLSSKCPSVVGSTFRTTKKEPIIDSCVCFCTLVPSPVGTQKPEVNRLFSVALHLVVLKQGLSLNLTN